MSVMPAQPGAPAPPTKSGCLKWGAVGCAVALLLGAIGAVAIVTVVFGAIKSTSAFKESLNRAQKDPRVIEALGTPVEPGWFVTGKVRVDNSNGSADIRFPIAGPKGKANVHVVATRDSSGWHYSRMLVRPENGTTIDLLSP